MSTPRCCGAKRPRRGGRSLEAAGWVVPGTLLALMPKCPVCLAAYVAVGTGVGLSVTAAGYLRLFLVAVCAVSLVFVAVRRGRRLVSGFMTADAGPKS